MTQEKNNTKKCPSPCIDLAYRGEVEALRVRLDAGDDPNDEAQHFSGATPLFCASRYGHPACVALLIGRGADVSVAHPVAGTALHGAATSGHAESIRMLLAGGAAAPAVLEAVDVGGDTALTLAAYSGHAEVVKILLSAGSDASFRHPEYGTALEMAVKEGHAETAAALRGEAYFARNAKVRVHGLVGAAQYNGKIGKVLKLDAGSGRYIVVVGGGAVGQGEGGGGGAEMAPAHAPATVKIKVKPANLERAA